MKHSGLAFPGLMHGNQDGCDEQEPRQEQEPCQDLAVEGGHGPRLPARHQRQRFIKLRLPTCIQLGVLPHVI
jgi:hypothetical protein